MKQRSNCYLATFPNTQEGLSAYRTFRGGFRVGTKSGRLVKMFRDGTRKEYVKGSFGSCHNDGTRFDVYHYARYKYVDNNRVKL